MIEKFRPDVYAKNIYTIDYEKLLKRGIKCLLFDLDNTISPVNMPLPDKKAINHFFDLKEMGFHLIIMSNSPKSRVEPFKNILETDSVAFALKPKKISYLKIMKTFKYKPEQVAAIGDQLLTDMYGANNVGITTILVNPISKVDGVTTKLNRCIEKTVEKKLKRKEMFSRGEYYD